MLTNIKVSTTDAEREHIANLLDRRVSKRKATRQELHQVVNAFIETLLQHDIATLEENAHARPDEYVELSKAEQIIVDLDFGAWSFINQPPSAEVL